MICNIPLSNGHEALVSEEDYALLSGLAWNLSRDGYAITSNSALFKKHFSDFKLPESTRPLMHRVVLRAAAGVHVDHINGNRLDNRRVNLRFANKSQNQMNSKSRPGESKFKGVSWHHRDQHWRATLVLDGKQIYLGKFNTEEAAAAAYDSGALHWFGDFARLNFPGRAPKAYSPWAPPVKSGTGFIGVTAANGRFIASQTVQGTRVHLGSFDTAKAAATCREAYITSHQLKARRNFA